jgi:DNA repair protein RecO (recombination protein O)
MGTAAPRHLTVEAIVIKRLEYQEADRLITLFSKQVGKISVLAKGVRLPKSKRQASLELGTCIKAQIIQSHRIPILTQTVIVNSFSQTKLSLPDITRLYQLLEVIDLLTPEQEPLPEVYGLLVDALTKLPTTSNKKALLLHTFHSMVQVLGFIPPKSMDELSLKNLIETIADKKLHSKEFLMPGTIKPRPHHLG